MKGTYSEGRTELEDKVDFLVDLVKDLRLEIRSLRQEVQELESNNNTASKPVKQEDPRDPDDTPIIEGDICEVLNSYKGLKGTRFKVTKSTGDKIHFIHNGYPTWRARKNVRKLAHARY